MTDDDDIVKCSDVIIIYNTCTEIVSKPSVDVSS